MAGFRAPVTTSFDEARALALGWAALPTVTVPLAEALGCVLAVPLASRTDLPAFPTSAMDGWAVAGRGPWRLRPGRALAGSPVDALADGEAVEIATGAMVPDGAEAVLRREDGAVDGAQLVGAVSPGSEVLPVAGECKQGDELLAAGSRVTPPVLGLAAATGHDELQVRRPPTVAVAVLGDELLDRGLPGQGRVRDSLSLQLPGWVAGLGGRVVASTRVPDELPATVAALATEADVVVSTGGTAAGPVDHVHGALRELGAELLADGVACRPGHPMVLARLADGRPYVGLPGNPLSAFVSVLTLLAPLLDALSGKASGALPTVVVGEALKGRDPDNRLVPVALNDGVAVPATHVGSMMLRGLAHADGVVVVPPHGAAEGDRVRLLGLPW
ncbi:MAG: molybdopterin molybdenumtransferase MoeA [Frankiales bacterium]|nr:molybdopterin molybdenumtransferase MoeA [Frankiales bacterium]